MILITTSIITQLLSPNIVYNEHIGTIDIVNTSVFEVFTRRIFLSDQIVK